MQYIVLDLEWNQALSQDSIRHKGIKIYGEIIQIGAARLGTDGKVTDTIRLNVAPKYYKKMHWSVRKLTGISTKSLAKGQPFPEAYAEFAQWCGKDVAFLTWGPDDLPMLRDNLKLHNMSTRSLPEAFDLQRIFARQIAGEKRQFSLADAMAQLNVVTDHPAHDALNDALNTAAVCEKLDLAEGIARYNDPFPAKPKPESEFDGLPRIIYPSYEEMAKSEFEQPVNCPVCDEVMTLGKWIRRSPGKRINLATCVCGASFLLKVRWKTDEASGHVFVTRITEEPTREQSDSYQRAISQRRRPRHRKSKRAGEAKEPVTV